MIGNWQSPPKSIHIESKQVHIWRAIMTMTKENAAHYWNYLSVDERQRAKKFHFKQQQEEYISAKGILRSILSKYISIDPEQLLFSYSYFGKPRLQLADTIKPIYFNVSHSQNCFLYAVSADAEIGVDIEYYKPINFTAIAKDFFSVIEYQQFSMVPEIEIGKLFYTLWTCKEAFIKAISKGLSFPLKEFDIQIENSNAKVISIQNNNELAKSWTLETFNPCLNYFAAFAIKHQVENVCHWLWDEQPNK